MNKWIILLQAVLCGWAMAMPDGTVVKRVSAGKHDALLQPLSAEQARPYETGFVRDGEIYRCDNGADAKTRRGVMWSIELNQTNATPIAASAWAKAEDPSDTSTSPDFSLYLDLTYMDGTPLYGQSASFATDDKTGWHKREVVVTPDKPLKRVSYYLLFRNRAGKVLFKEPRFGTLAADDARHFDGVLTSQTCPPEAGFLLRDVAAESDFVSINKQAIGITLSTQQRHGTGGDHLRCHADRDNGA
jgi:hypothetical protein